MEKGTVEIARMLQPGGKRVSQELGRKGVYSAERSNRDPKGQARRGGRTKRGGGK